MKLRMRGEHIDAFLDGGALVLTCQHCRCECWLYLRTKSVQAGGHAPLPRLVLRLQAYLQDHSDCKPRQVGS